MRLSLARAGFEVLESRHLLAANPLDATFDLDGLSTTSFDQFFENFTRLTHAPNGKIYAVGNIQSQWLIARYSASDGMLDTTFDGDGFKLLPMTGFSTPTAVIAQGDGKLLLGGTTGGNAAVVRLTTAGALDNTWSDDGIWTGAWAGQTGNSLAGLQFLEGKLYAAGDDSGALYLSRFNDNGTLDTTYGGANTGTYTFLPPEAGLRPAARGLELVPAVSSDPFDSFEGPKLAFLGQYISSTNQQTQTRGLLAEFYSNGDVATPFGTNGVTTFAATGGSLSTLATDEFGRIIVGGAVAQVATIFRFTDHGAPDTSFSGDGAYASSPAFGVSAVSAGIGKGRIVFAGSFTSGAIPTSRLVALTDAGELDTTFGNNGVFARSGMGRFTDAIPTGDGKVVFAGTVFYSDDQRNTQLARVTFDPQPNTTISGAIFNDMDGDGVQDAGESNYSGFGISAYLDLNKNGVFDSFNEPSSYAGNTGNYSFAVTPGGYTVRITGLAAVSQRQTTPANNGGVSVTAVANANTLAGLFGVQRVHGVPGYVFNDTNGNGLFDSGAGGETTIPGRTVYADANNNGGLDAGEVSGVTDDSGRYVLMLPQGNHRLRQILPAGWAETGRQTDSINSQFPTTGVVAVPTDLDPVAVRNFYFGAQVAAVDNGSIAGVVFDDADDDGSRDAGEAGLANVRVYIDANGNALFDSGTEQNMLTASDGSYAFTKLLSGTYNVRSVVATGRRSTAPINNVRTINLQTNQASTNNLFGHTARAAVSGYLFNDRNGNGLDDSGEEELNGWRVYLDLNGNGQLDTSEPSQLTAITGSYTFRNLATGSYVVRLVPQSGWRSTNGDNRPVTLGSGEWPVVRQFGVQQDSFTGSISGTVYNDADNNGVRATGEGGVSGATVFLDANNDFNHDPGEVLVVTDSTGNFTFSNLPAGTHNVHVEGPTGEWLFTTPFGGHRSVTLTSGQTSTGTLFGMIKPGVPTPYSGTPITIANSPVTIEAEHYDKGGELAGYHDTDATNGGAAFRNTEGVDLSLISGSNYRVTETFTDEWLKYSVNVPADGNYDVTFRVSSAGAGGTFILDIPDAGTAGPVVRVGPTAIPNTGSDSTWTTITKRIFLSTGQYSLRLYMNGVGATGRVGNFDSIQLTPVPAQTPFKGAPFAVGATPVTIQAEDYDLGGQGVAFNDTTATNVPGLYRPNEAVDIKSQASGQYRISDSVAGEWLEYTIDVASDGDYEMEFRVSHSDPNSKFHAEIDGVNVTGSLTVPDTNSFNTFASVRKTVALTAGRHVLRFAFDANASVGYAGGFDWVKFTKVTTPEPPPPPPPGGTVTLNNTIAAYVRNGSFAATNYGNDAQLVVKSSATSGNTREGYLRFDVSSLPSDPAQITNVKLRVWGRLSASGTGVNVAAYGVSNTSWSETAINWNTKPAAGSAIQTRTVTGTTGTYYEWDVTSLVKAARQNGQAQVSLALKATNNTDPQALFNSDDATSNKPQLVATTSTPTAPSQAIVVDNDGLIVPEGGTKSFTVKLAAAPASNVTVTISKQAGSDPDVTADKSTLTFTPANWNVAQTVTLSAAEDADSVQNQSFFSLASSGLSTVDVWAIESENDGPATEPTVFIGDSSTVRDGTYASQNFGTATELVVKKSANAGNTRESYLKFDFSTVESVTSAKLRINARLSDASVASLLTQIYSVSNTTWSETGITWNNKPTTGSTLRGSFTVSGTGATWYEIDLTSFIQAEFAAGRKVVTLVLRNPNTSDAQTLIPSDETANAPQLIVG